MLPDRIYISVILPLRLEWCPFYWVSPDGDVRRGTRVRVRFAGKDYSAVVLQTGVEPDTDENKILSISSVENLPPVSEEELRLWGFISEYYMCTLGEVYKAAYPSVRIGEEMALRQAEERRAQREAKEREALALKVRTMEEHLAGKRAAFEALRDGTKKKAQEEAVIGRLEARLADARAQLAPLLDKGPQQTSSAGDVPARTAAMAAGGSLPISTAGYQTSQVAGSEPYASILHAFGDNCRQVADKVQRGEAAGVASAPQDGAESDLSPDQLAAGERNMPGLMLPELTEAQGKAAETIRKAFGDGKTALLRGVTGSGKTEIYMTLAAETLARGRNVLFLVPEIALSRQLEDRLRLCFGAALQVFHSAETPAGRRDVAEAVRRGPYVVLGTRSAIFLPHRELGLVIVDEEHDTSYKQDSPAPRYSGRTAAVMLGSIHGTHVLLGSATPSLETIYNCLSGKYALVKLDEKYYGGSGCEVEIIDTSAERRKRGMVGSLSRKLIAHISETLARGEQVVVLRGRKAYSPAVQCQECGHMPKCSRCNVPLSYHKDRNALVCHYCGRWTRFSGVCPECGGALVPIGSGTQKIEEELAALFPAARIDRLDGDNAAASGRIVKAFARGEIDILVGTQMVSKGFDFANLTLVAVVQSDSLLGQMDFRADEKAFQLLEQLRGRGGRRGKRSLFVVQTAQSGHPVYAMLDGGSEEGFENEELAVRKEFGYPPYTRIVNIVLKDSNQARLDKLAPELAAALSASASGATVSGPYPPPVDRQAGLYIRHIRISLKRDRLLAANKRRILLTLRQFCSERAWTGHVSIDVDPA